MLHRVLGIATVLAAALASDAPAPKQIASFEALAGGSLAVGPSQVVQIVDSQLAVFDKSGKKLSGPVAANSIFKGFGGNCEAHTGGAAVRYDQLAGRWLYVMPIVNPTYSMCFAVSTGADPLGPYHRYEFHRQLPPDDPQPAVWPDGYYTSGRSACVADRAKMLTGGPATEQCVALDKISFLSADIDGQGVPPAGAPNILVGAGEDGLYYRTFHVDWRNPKNTKLSDAVRIPVEAYRGGKLTPRLVYRNIAGRESLVAGGERWYELRLDAKREPQLFQQGTASAAMDKQGNLAIGIAPQSAAMDPSDDCTFWAATSTRIEAFRLPGCLRGTVSGAAYIDLNHDGKRQEGEPGIKGREIAYTGAESGKATTDASGAYRISLPADPAFADPVYTVAGKSFHLKDGDALTMDFPSVCTTQSTGAADVKFWLGSKGQDAINRHYGEFKKLVNNTLYLVNADGTRITFKKYVMFRAWLHKPPSPLMGAMAVAGLNAEAGALDGNATVHDPVAGDWVSIHVLLKRVSDAAAAKKPTDSYKALLDALNNNTATITPANPDQCLSR